jgi:hypothetical protein
MAKSHAGKGAGVYSNVSVANQPDAQRLIVQVLRVAPSGMGRLNLQQNAPTATPRPDETLLERRTVVAILLCGILWWGTHRHSPAVHRTTEDSILGVAFIPALKDRGFSLPSGKTVGVPQVALKVPFAFPLFYNGNAYDFSRDLSTIVYARPGGHADLYLLSQK